MYYLFTGAESFNKNLNSWNVTNVTNMTRMFQNASSFNQPLWDTLEYGHVQCQSRWIVGMFQKQKVFSNQEYFSLTLG